MDDLNEAVVILQIWERRLIACLFLLRLGCHESRFLPFRIFDDGDSSTSAGVGDDLAESNVKGLGLLRSCKSDLIFNLRSCLLRLIHRLNLQCLGLFVLKIRLATNFGMRLQGLLMSTLRFLVHFVELLVHGWAEWSEDTAWER